MPTTRTKGRENGRKAAAAHRRSEAAIEKRLYSMKVAVGDDFAAAVKAEDDAQIAALEAGGRCWMRAAGEKELLVALHRQKQASTALLANVDGVIEARMGFGVIDPDRLSMATKSTRVSYPRALWVADRLRAKLREQLSSEAQDAAVAVLDLGGVVSIPASPEEAVPVASVFGYWLVSCVTESVDLVAAYDATAQRVYFKRSDYDHVSGEFVCDRQGEDPPGDE
jgi:hypothetical protein